MAFAGGVLAALSTASAVDVPITLSSNGDGGGSGSSHSECLQPWNSQQRQMALITGHTEICGTNTLEFFSTSGLSASTLQLAFTSQVLV